MDPFLTSYFFAKGIAIGLVAAAPIGPVNLLVMHRTLRHGRIAGLLTGLGAVLGDGVFAAIAAFGISAVSGFILAWAFWIQIIGAGMLFVMGIKTFRAEPQISCANETRGPWYQTFASTLALTITNPMTMVGFAALFAGIGGVGEGDFGSAASLVLGVMSGSMLWWVIVSQGIALIRGHMDQGLLRLVNRISGSMILFFGFAMLGRLVIASL